LKAMLSYGLLEIVDKNRKNQNNTKPLKKHYEI